MADFYDVILGFQDIGVYAVVLPFLLVFSIAYALLQKIKILGDNKGVNVVVSMALGFIFLRNQFLVESVNKFLANVSVVIVILLMFLLVFGIFAGPHSWTGNALTAAFVLSLVGIILSLATDFGPGWMSDFLGSFWYSIDPGTQGMILFIIVIIVVISLVTKKEKGPNEKGFFGNIVKDIQGKP